MSGTHMQVVVIAFFLCFCCLLTGIVSAESDNSTLSQPDLVITVVSSNDNEIFAHESNTVTATVKNTGTGTAGAFNVRVRINGVDTIVPVASLASGNTAQVSATDSASRLNGASVTINVVADPEGAVNETDETNNVLEKTKTVVNNGYKGKRFTDDSDMTTKATFSIRGDLIFSPKIDYQGSGNWDSKTVTWTAGDTPVPSGGSVKEVRLYVPYNWDGDKIIPGGVSMTFNGNAVSPAGTYSDTKGYGGYNYPSGLLVYTVTSQYSAAGSNTATITRTSSAKGPSLNGMILVVIYEDNTKTRKEIFLNEETDILKRYESDTWISPEEATAYATFSGNAVDLSNVVSARLITVAGSAKPGEGNLIFNGQTWTGVWNGGDDTTFGYDDRSVKDYLISSGNGVQFRAGVTGDYFVPTNAILVVEYAGLLTTQTTVVTTEPTTIATIETTTTDEPGSNTTGNISSTPTAPTKVSTQSSTAKNQGGIKTASQQVSGENYGSGTREITGNDDLSESSESSNVLVPVPLVVVGAAVLFNSIIAVIGLLIITRDLKAPD